jgi:hypothetical protein
MSDRVYYDRDVIELMGRERFARVVDLDRHHHNDEGARYWLEPDLLECEQILDWEDGRRKKGRQGATPDGPE